MAFSKAATGIKQHDMSSSSSHDVIFSIRLHSICHCIITDHWAAGAEFASTSAMLCRCPEKMCHFDCNTSDAVNTSITSMAKVSFPDLF